MEHQSNLLREKIQNRKAVICVIGLGYVGLPLAVELARVGHTVVGIDVLQSTVDMIKATRSPIPGIDSKELADLQETNKLNVHLVNGKAFEDSQPEGRLSQYTR